VLLRSDSLLPIAKILFLATMRSSQRMPLRSTYQQMMFQTGFSFTAKTRNFVSLRNALSACSLRGGEHEFTAILMRACARCSRDEIETVYRLRVVIETPRIELGDFPCNAGLVEICVPDAAQAGHNDCGFWLSQSLAVGYCSMRVNADQTIRPGCRTCRLL
jgi:hypothetical protein